jgi:hypothetical protein
MFMSTMSIALILPPDLLLTMLVYLVRQYVAKQKKITDKKDY